MKKEIFIILTIIIAIIGMHIFTQNKKNMFFEEIVSELDSIEGMIISEDFEKDKINSDITNLLEKWRESRDEFACFIAHEELENAEIQLIVVDANIRVEDYTKSVEEIERCKFILRNIEQRDSLNIMNIL